MDKVLIVTYYWPPSGGSGVQRWLYFSRYLPEYGIQPYVITVDPSKASYKFLDPSHDEKVKDIPVYRTDTLEPLKLYSKMLSGDKTSGIPQGFAGEARPSLFQKMSRWVRGNFFIPDARIGWNKFAFRKAEEVIRKEGISLVITTGPPHSTHFIGKKLKEKCGVKWIADFRDPWSEVYYNRLLYRTSLARYIDRRLEKNVLNSCDMVLTIGPSMRELLAKKVVESIPVEFVYNGFDSDHFENLKAQRSDKLVMTHIGILGESQPISSLLIALKDLLSEDQRLHELIVLRFIGKVSEVIIDEVKQMLPSVTLELVPYMPHKEAIQEMLNANLLLNSLAETGNEELLISGKLMEYLASGNPILCLGSETGDAAKLLSGFPYCSVYSRRNIQGIRTFLSEIIELYKVNNLPVRHFSDVSVYSRKNSTSRLAEVIRRLG